MLTLEEKKYQVKVEDTVKVDKDYCENSDGECGIFPREFKFGGIGCLLIRSNSPFP